MHQEAHGVLTEEFIWNHMHCDIIFKKENLQTYHVKDADLELFLALFINVMGLLSRRAH